ncbi:Ferripyoverdine receptor precursor [Lacunisphaera limnophila]|uniref:Ferripyoverdine receptor n=1 Tax=Lacunisphaera limnophila TaxID=1838286 RepID=A0A1D8ATI4_9BACT|nr:TonB-dependent receptor [Lacunisphaera limnophila]AOS44197.1 Ferripyoverdine receptor precursor [Lacunisphaera limnophila]
MTPRIPVVFTRARAAGCCCLALFALSAQAQTTPTTPTAAPAPVGETVVLPTFSVSTNKDSGYRAANSVSATRVDTAIKDLPFAISAFTEQFITDVGARDLFDVVQYAPSVTSAGKEFNSGNSVYAIRGFDQAPQHNGFVGEGYVDTATIERVEVVKGPSSLLYGQVAPGGTVNYITKRAHAKARTSINAQFGTHNFWRTGLDVNQPLVGDKLLFRFNGVYENGLEFLNPGAQKTRVLAPTLTWNISDRVALTVDYQWFRRRENPPQAQLKPNVEIVGLPPASGILSASGLLINPLNNIDPGFLTYYPLPRDFNYVSRSDYRDSDYESVNAELTARLNDHWTARANFNWNTRRVAHKLTGLGAVSITVPTSYYPTGATLPISAANYRLAAIAYAEDLLTNIDLALLAPQAQLGRRKRLQEDWGFGRTSQLEFAGSYVTHGVKLKPLVGFFYNESVSRGLLRSSPTASFFPVWDMKNPATWNYDTDFDPGAQPITTNSRSPGRNSAAYAIMNASFLEDRLNVVAGARYNKSSGATDNLLNPAASVAKVSAKKITPQAGMGWKITRDMMIYASYSQSYVNNAAALQRANVPIGPAKPTTAEGYELGLKTDFLGGRVSSTVAIFQIDQKDRILRFNSFNSSGVTVTNSLQDTIDRSKGIEAELTWSPVDNWQVYLSGAMNDIRVIQVPPGMEAFIGSHPEATVKALFNLWTRYSFTQDAVKGLWVGGGFNHTGRKAQRTNNPRLFLPADTLWNSAIGYDWKRGDRDMSVVVNWQNMEDIEYYPANQQRGLPGRATVSFTTRF